MLTKYQKMKPYENDSTRWEAYQFSDPYATDAFVCLNISTRIVCRPNCDFYSKCESKQDVQFFESSQSIKSNNYKFCNHCDPSSPKTALNLELIKMTTHSINNSIGFTEDSNDLKRRAYSVSSLNTTDPHFKGERQLSRNESEHFKLVELACRHIAAAAISNLAKQQSRTNSPDDVTKKKKRGGVLGFKELAVKSKLSAWHFHRVFKSVTGLTPKSYGDRCWEFIKGRDRPMTLRQQHCANNESHFFKSMSSDIYSTNVPPSQKLRRKSEFLSPLEIGNDVTGNLATLKPRKKRKILAHNTTEVKRSNAGSKMNLSSNENSTASTTASATSVPVSESSNASSRMSGPLSAHTTVSTPPSSISSLNVPLIDQLELSTELPRPNAYQDINKNSLDINNVPVRHQTIDLGIIGNMNSIEYDAKILSPSLTNFNPFENNLSVSLPPTQSTRNQPYAQFVQPHPQLQPRLPQTDSQCQSQFNQRVAEKNQPLPSQKVSAIYGKLKEQTPTHQAALTNKQHIDEPVSNNAPQYPPSNTSVASVPISVKMEDSNWPTLQGFALDQLFETDKRKQTPESVMSESDLIMKSQWDLYDFMTQSTNDFFVDNAYLFDSQKGELGNVDANSCLYDVSDSMNVIFSDNPVGADEAVYISPDAESEVYPVGLPVTNC